jgi:CheY-like chemotaxis protein
MDGVTAVKQIRLAEAQDSLDRQLVFTLTGNARQERIDQALAAGMDVGECLSYRLC